MKGIVVEVNQNNAVMLSNTGEFVNVPNKNYEVGQRVRYSKNLGVTLSAIVSAVVFFCIVGFAGWKFYTNPVSYVDVEVNPHIRIELNSFEKVVNVTPLNYDGQKLIDAVGKPNPDVKMCIQSYLDKATEMGYIDKDNKDVRLDVTSPEEGSFNLIVNQIKSMEEQNSGIEMIINSSKTDSADEAVDETAETEKSEDSENDEEEKDSDSEDNNDEDNASDEDEEDSEKTSSKSSNSSSKKTKNAKSSDDEDEE